MSNIKVFRRKRIEDDLSNIMNYSLTVVSATMGYGKTTSVREFLRNQKVNTIWISMTSSQGVETIFWNKLCKGIREFFPETGDKLSELGFPFNLVQINEAIDYISEFKSDGKTVLVIDDYHLIEHNKQTGTLIELIIQEEIPDLHIVLLTRIRPNFKYIDLMTKGLCYYIDSTSLAFTKDEICEYFIFMGFEALTKKETKRIEDYTKGWISAIYLIMLGLKQGLHTEVSSNINKLIEVNLFNQLDSQTRDALMSLSVFDSFTIPQAIEVLGNNNVRQIVNGLIDKNAFITFDPLTGGYQLHKVLKDYLQIRLDNSSVNVKALYRCAGKWYAEREDYVTAFNYYYRAGEIEELLDHLNKIEMVDISLLDNDIMFGIYSELPQYLSIKYPILFLQVALNFIFSGEKSMINKGVGIITLIKEFYSQTEGFSSNLREKIFAELEVIYAIMAFNDVKQVLQHVRNAGKLFHGGVSSLIFRHSEFTFGLPCFLYSYYSGPGKLRETVDLIFEEHTPVFLDGCGYGCEYLALAELNLLTGDLEEAEINANKAILKARIKMQVCIELAADFTLMRLYLLKGKKTEAKLLIREARKMLIELKAKLTNQSSLIYNTTLDLSEGYIFGCLKQAESIPDWLRAGDFSGAAYIFQGLGFPNIVYEKAVMLSGNWMELEILCDSCKQEYNIFHNQLGLLHNSIHESAAKYHLYGKDAGLEVLLPALKEAQLDGIIIPFAENADYLLPLLESESVKGELDPGYYKKLIHLCNKYNNNLKTHARNTAILTERETEVLNLLAEGLTQKEIASLLIVSSSTVKRHLENIYQKLDVNNKISAINSAKSQNII